MRVRRSHNVLQPGLFSAGEKGLNKLAQIAKAAKEFLLIAGHSGSYSMELVAIAKRETMVLDAVIPMPSKRQLRNGRKPSKSQHLGQPGLHKKLDQKFDLAKHRTFKLSAYLQQVNRVQIGASWALVKQIY
jgi:hypothetical protein